MSRWEKCYSGTALTAAAFVLAAAAPAAHAAFIIGDWENADDGWIDWNGGSPVSISTLPSKYAYTPSGATLGSSALQLTQSGWNQDLSLKLQSKPGAIAAFLANTQFQIDVTLPATTSSGWAQIYDLAINAQGYGFHSLTANPVPGAQWGWGSTGGAAQTYTLTFDYSALVDGDAGNGEISPSAGYIEFIFATNNDGTHTTFLFDNARLTAVPEPASLAACGLATLPLLTRRRRA